MRFMNPQRHIKENLKIDYLTDMDMLILKTNPSMLASFSKAMPILTLASTYFPMAPSTKEVSRTLYSMALGEKRTRSLRWNTWETGLTENLMGKVKKFTKPPSNHRKQCSYWDILEGTMNRIEGRKLCILASSKMDRNQGMVF